ncbi:RNA polymerase-binding protein RbpA, partial [Streptomyces microflavus]|uniref:RNA polymerase-binding protein RbpA n=1 Tax=Streptomyces microflavus TaxID=1919 RepID=UPI0033BF8E24
EQLGPDRPQGLDFLRHLVNTALRNAEREGIAQALLVDGDGPEEKKGKPARTHWDMLMERRTREELEEVLAERLAVLRSGAMNIAVHPRDSRKSA